ncbi:MAG: hypothetical protein H0U67_11930, partial [Gemmatimonadetes bacterium]|nr:hypothetical protein [Gemmatimonadota bacterium]
QDGAFVLRYTRSDGSVRTYWLEAPGDAALADPSLHAVLPEHAVLAELSPALLEPQKLPGLWIGGSITVADLYSYFAGGHTVTVNRPTPQGIEIPHTYTIPKAEPEAIQKAVAEAVEQSRLWLTSGSLSLWGEPIPAGTLTDRAVLRAPPAAIPPLELLPERLTVAWNDGGTTARALYDALQEQHETRLPWKVVQQALSGAVQARILEPVNGGVRWPLDFADADRAGFRLAGPQEPDGRVHEPPVHVRVAKTQLGVDELQDLADIVGELQSAAAGHSIRFIVQVELGGEEPLPEEVVEEVSKLLGSVSDRLELR